MNNDNTTPRPDGSETTPEAKPYMPADSVRTTGSDSQPIEKSYQFPSSNPGVVVGSVDFGQTPPSSAPLPRQKNRWILVTSVIAVICVIGVVGLVGNQLRPGTSKPA